MPQTSLKRIRPELTAFLRARRERLDPADFDLPASGRRRTRGLRREELATIAGVGLTWYTWFEQGREIRVSAHFLARIASILHLDAAERAYLDALVHGAPSTGAREAAEISALDLTPLLQQVEPWPAFVKDTCWQVLAWNGPADRLLGGLDDLRPEDRNTLWMTFMHAPYRMRMASWLDDARRIVARFRADYVHSANDSRARHLVARLRRASAEFDVLWNDQDVRGRGAGERVFRTADGHDQCYRYVVSRIEGAAGLRMVVYMPR